MKFFLVISVLIIASSAVVQCQSSAQTTAETDGQEIADSVTNLGNSSSLGALVAPVLTLLYYIISKASIPVSGVLGGYSTISGPSTPANTYADAIDRFYNIPVEGSLNQAFLGPLGTIVLVTTATC